MKMWPLLKGVATPGVAIGKTQLGRLPLSIFKAVISHLGLGAASEPEI